MMMDWERKNDMKYGNFLKDHGRIGFIAPSFGCVIEPYRTSFDHALEVLKKKGFRIALGPNVYEGKGLGISNTPDQCAKEFEDWYIGEEADVLVSCGGGELMCEILPFLPFEKIAKAPAKWFMGYSDNSNLVFTLATLCDTAAIYGPCGPAFGMEPWHPAIGDALDMLQGRKLVVSNYKGWELEGKKDADHPLEPYTITEPFALKTWPESDVRARGRLLGGCLDSLVNLCGTAFDQVKEFSKRYEKDGILWFLEACDLNVLSIRRALWHLDQAGWFSTARGFIIGRPYMYGEEIMGLDQYRAVTDILGKYNLPIVMDADIGHHPPMMPLISGSLGSLETRGNRLRLTMELV